MIVITLSVRSSCDLFVSVKRSVIASFIMSSRRPVPFKGNARRQNPGAGKVTTISHREYVDFVAMPQAIYGYPLQPSDTATFTWLPAIASRYEMYRVKSCEFSFVSSAGMNTNGSIQMAVDYDCLDMAPTTIEHMSTFSSYVDEKIVCDVKLRVNPVLANRLPWHYTAIGLPTMYDKKTYDFGVLYVSTSGDTVSAVGRLYVTYTFEFCSPTVEDQSLTTLNFQKTHSTSEASMFAGTPVVTAVAGPAPLLALGLSPSATWTDRDGETATGTAQSFKALKDFIGELTWGWSDGPYDNTSASVARYYPPELYEGSSASGPWTRKLAHDSSGFHELVRNASDYIHNNASAGSAGGLLEVVLEAGKYYALPWFKKPTTNPTSSNGPLDSLMYLRSTTGGLAGIFDLIAETQNLQKKALADKSSTKSDSVTKEDETKSTSKTSDAPICRCKVDCPDYTAGYSGVRH
jgi:hypothetical protein